MVALAMQAGRTRAQGSGFVFGASFFPAPWRGQEAHSLPRSSLGECLLQIQDIVRRRQLLTIFREGKDGQQDVDVAILQALLKGEGWVKWGPGGKGGKRVLRTLSIEEPKIPPLGQTHRSEGSERAAGGAPLGAHPTPCWASGCPVTAVRA